jgi:hypothetical protein
LIQNTLESNGVTRFIFPTHNYGTILVAIPFAPNHAGAPVFDVPEPPRAEIDLCLDSSIPEVLLAVFGFLLRIAKTIWK